MIQNKNIDTNIDKNIDTNIDKNKNTINNKYISINSTYICLNTLPKNIITLNDIINNLQKSNHSKHYNKYYNYNNYYIIYNGKLFDKNKLIKSLLEFDEIYIYIDIIERQYGGGGFGDMIVGFLKIGDFFLTLMKGALWIIKFIPWFIEFLLWLFTDLLKPSNFLYDFFNSLKTLILTICKIPFDVLLAFFALSVNTVGGWMQGFWGWDETSITKKDRDSNYFKKINKSKGKKCYLTSSNTVPFSIILGTILCPPIGVFMDMGLTGWLNIVICILLTLLFYIPGLVYALLVIYS